MWRFILVTFVFLGWSFYELSDDADFTPEQRIAQSDVPQETTPTQGVSAVAPVTETAGYATPRPIALPHTTTFAPVTLASLPAPETRNSAFAVDTGNARRVPRTDVETEAETATQADQPAPPQTAVVPPSNPVKPKYIREVRGTRVNMRGGPGTRYSVLAKLTKGMEVEVIGIPGDGWVKLRVIETGRVGWMAERLVTAAIDR
ncbi:MAG: SH3 domain-containing protein [Rhodobacterales bacterium]|nr:SH3 domain-containing protein [Rhodobacterales bacterium]